MFPLLWMACSSVATAWTADLDPGDWSVINDTVMGGVSQARVTRGEAGSLVFDGALSLENNGGFTSIRTRVTEPDWTDAEALRLRVKGDGRTYICTVRIRDRRMQRIYYRASFQTDPSDATEVVLPFSDFEPYVFGRRVPQVPMLNSMLSRIGSVGVMLSDKQEGTFSLAIKEIQTMARAEDASEDNPRDDSSVAAIFQTAITSGVPLFNAGRPEQCAEVYDSAIASVLMLPDDQLTARSRALREQARDRADSEQDPSAKAWVYRHAMDWVLGQFAN